MTSYRPGDFVDCIFPFDEAPRSPGPTPHVVYVQKRLAEAGQLYVLTFYTTTVRRPPTQPRRAGTIEVPLANAQAMGMPRAFTIDTRRVGILPIRADFFPGFERPDGGVRGHAPKRLKLALGRIFAEGVKAGAPLRLYRIE